MVFPSKTYTNQRDRRFEDKWRKTERFEEKCKAIDVGEAWKSKRLFPKIAMNDPTIGQVIAFRGPSLLSSNQYLLALFHIFHVR